MPPKDKSAPKKSKLPTPSSNQARMDSFLKRPGDQAKSQTQENQPSSTPVNEFSNLNVEDSSQQDKAQLLSNSSTSSKDTKSLKREIVHTPGPSPVKKSQKKEESEGEDSVPLLEATHQPNTIKLPSLNANSNHTSNSIQLSGILTTPNLSINNNNAVTSPPNLINITAPYGSKDLAKKMLQHLNYKFPKTSISNINSLQNSLELFQDAPPNKGKFAVLRTKGVTSIQYIPNADDKNPPGSKVPTLVCKNDTNQLTAIIVCQLDDLLKSDKGEQIKSIFELGLEVMVIIDATSNQLSPKSDNDWLKKIQGMLVRPGSKTGQLEANFASSIRVIYKLEGQIRYTTNFSKEKIFNNKNKINSFLNSNTTTGTTQTQTTTTQTQTPTVTQKTDSQIKASENRESFFYSPPVEAITTKPTKSTPVVDLTSDDESITASGLNAQLISIQSKFLSLLGDINFQNLPLITLQTLSEEVNALCQSSAVIVSNSPKDSELEEFKIEALDTKEQVNATLQSVTSIITAVEKYAKEICNRRNFNSQDFYFKTKNKLLELLDKDPDELTSYLKKWSDKDLLEFFGAPEEDTSILRKTLNEFSDDKNLRASRLRLPNKNYQQQTIKTYS